MTSTSSPRTATKGSLKSFQITGYLAGAVGNAALLSAAQAEAAVTAVSFSFGPELNQSDGFGNFTVVGGSFGTLLAFGDSSSLGLGVDGVGYGAVYHDGSSFGQAGLASFFTDATVIGGGGNGPLGQAAFRNNYVSSLNFTTDQLNKNIGFRTSTNHWGWANVSYDATAKSLAIHSAYVESIAGNTITVGQIGVIPEPSRALLALAGLAGVALRRRRKMAA